MQTHLGIFQSIGHLKIFVIMVAALAWGTQLAAADLTAAHELEVELFPASKKLIGKDVITVPPTVGDVLEFRVAERLSRLDVVVNEDPRKFSFENGRLRIKLEAHERARQIQVAIFYEAIFDDPVPVRPANTDNPGFGVTGTISEMGTFLLAGAGWYPELLDCHASYRVKVTAPLGVIAVTAGRSLGHRSGDGKTVSEWEVTYPVDGLSLSAAAYIVEEKPVGEVTAVTYLLPPNKQLSASYLDATSGYIKLYSDLFGPYPFQKFAVVENFFPTGFGFPSYTLMGGTVLRLPFIVHTSLGHEIAHCWWGNGVYVDYSEGNWSEGLTTYVADYQFKEMKSKEAARDYRRQALRNFATLVRPESDFSLNQFRSRYDPISKTIGYDKAAMVFHMLRRIVGEDAFWGALRDVYRDRLFRQTSWDDLRRALEVRGQRSLKNFFDQWLYRQGAPQFSLDTVHAEPVGGGWMVSGRVIQHRSDYDFPLMLALETPEQTISQKIEVSGPSTSFELICDDRPQKLAADPDFDIFRRLFPSEVPPAVNALKSSSSVRIVLSTQTDADIKKVAETLALSLGLKNYQIVLESELNRKELFENDILLIGRPRRNELLRNLSGRVTIRPTSFLLNKTLYNRSSDAFFGVFEHPYAENRIAALFLPLSSRHAHIVAGKITHYGKYSYLAFQNGKNRDKGIWPVENSPLVHVWNDLSDHKSSRDVMVDPKAPEKR